MGQEPETTLVTALVVLPLSYNPDRLGHRRPIEQQKFVETCEEVALRFGGGTFDDRPRRGFWASRGIIYEDEVGILEVDIPNTEQDKAWLLDYAKKVLLERFEQEAMHIKFVGPFGVHVVEPGR